MNWFVVLFTIALVASLALLGSILLSGPDVPGDVIHDGMDVVQTQRHPSTDSYMVAERTGEVYVYHGGERQRVLDLDVSYGEWTEYGLKSATYGPNGTAFVAYTDPGHHGIVQRFHHDPLEPHAEWIPGPILARVDYSSTPFHNVGEIEIGPEGALYVSWGDPSGVPGAQYRETPYGTVWRLTVDGGPWPDNPYPEVPEVYLYGLRNAWRIAFDEGALWTFDVGAGRTEEINRYTGEGPRNHGWPWYEGRDPYTNATTPDEHVFWAPSEDDDPLTWPVHTYGHEGGRCAVIGGVVAGRGVVFADHCDQSLYVLGDAGEVSRLVRLDGDRINSVDPWDDGSVVLSTRGGLAVVVEVSS